MRLKQRAAVLGRALRTLLAKPISGNFGVFAHGHGLPLQTPKREAVPAMTHIKFNEWLCLQALLKGRATVETKQSLTFLGC